MLTGEKTEVLKKNCRHSIIQGPFLRVRNKIKKNESNEWEEVVTTLSAAGGIERPVSAPIGRGGGKREKYMLLAHQGTSLTII